MDRKKGEILYFLYWVHFLKIDLERVDSLERADLTDGNIVQVLYLLCSVESLR